MDDEMRGGPFWSQGVTIVAGLNEPMTMALDSDADGSRRYSSSGLLPGLTLGETNGVLSGAARITGEFRAMIAVEREGYPTSFYAHRIVVEQREGGGGMTQWPAAFPSENNAVVRLRTGLGHAGNYHEGGVQRMEVLDPVPPGLAWSAATAASRARPPKAASTIWRPPFKSAAAIWRDPSLSISRHA